MVAATHPMPGHAPQNIPALNGLRGIACLMVAVSHATGLLQQPDYAIAGTMGVMLFFALSGFLMFFLYSETEFTTRSAFAYIVARIARIAPIYLVVVISAYLIYGYIDAGYPHRIDDGNVLRHLLFAGNVSIFWSVPPEVQFYGVFLIFWASLTSLLWRANAAPLLAFGAVCLVVLTLQQKYSGTFVGSHLHTFLSGGLAGLVFRRLKHHKLPRSLLVGLQLLLAGLVALTIRPLSAGPLMGVIATSYLPSFQPLLPSTTVGIMAAALVLSCCFSTPLTRVVLENVPMQKAGLYSFSIYLLHPVALHIGAGVADGLGASETVGSLVGLALLMPIGWLAYRAVENPGRRAVRALGERVWNGYESWQTARRPAVNTSAGD
ncbi:MAG TPA: acyltransferase [Xanthobacteraceae bacterium]|nr:acyltransferase [Xanthobacteraceae bacterium]